MSGFPDPESGNFRNNPAKLNKMSLPVILLSYKTFFVTLTSQFFDWDAFNSKIQLTILHHNENCGR